jgi:hypothetical protein
MDLLRGGYSMGFSRNSVGLLGYFGGFLGASVNGKIKAKKRFDSVKEIATTENPKYPPLKPDSSSHSLLKKICLHYSTLITS